MNEISPEFSRVIAVEPDMGSGDDAETFAIEASPEERAALAKRFGLIAIESLSASGAIDVSARGRRARLTATLRARVVQACVVSLAPVPASVEETFTLTYDRQGGRRIEVKEESFDLDTEEPPEPLPEGGIDVGEAVAEHLGLALDPYPRAAGVEFRDPAAAPQGKEPAKPSPFAALARLKTGQKP